MTEQTHSPLGASGAERWMNCAGSFTLLKTLQLPPTDEPDYRHAGTAAHEALAHCLKEGKEGWEIVGDKFNGVEVTTEMADAVQMFLTRDREDLASELAAVREYTETHLKHPSHELCYGTIDRGLVWPGIKRVKVKDFKYGEGVMVDADENPQLMYYAYLLLTKLDLQDAHEWKVELEIVQPRGFHQLGPIRTWETDAQYILDWGNSVLLPAMEVAQVELDFNAGDWCRFCPAKLVCPLMNSLFGAAMKADPKEIKELTMDEIARSYQHVQAVEQYVRALKEEAYRRLFTGETHEAIKLVPKKANRVWNGDAAAVFKEKFGAKAFTEPTIKSPAEMEKIDGEAKALVKQHAYTPQTGLTVALASDKRPAVKVETTIQAFPNALDYA
jgi:hypothetical protein